MNIFESHDATLGERATEMAHRRIELQSPADLSYLVANVQRAARNKIDRDLPPAATRESEDAMRLRVEELVDAYIRNTFSLAKNSITINGMDSKELDAELAKAQEGEEIEPFDTKLAQRIQALSSEIESHTLQLANLRRTAPVETSQRFQQSFDRESERYDMRLRQDEERRLEAARNTALDVGSTDRLDEVQRTWQNGSDQLNLLKTGMGGTMAKMEKAQRAIDVLDQ